MSKSKIASPAAATKEPPGGTHSIGFTFTADGRRLVATTGSPGQVATPLPWRYLARNPDVDIASGTRSRGQGLNRAAIQNGQLAGHNIDVTTRPSRLDQ